MESARAEFGFLVNGQPVDVRGIAPQVTLLDFVRSQGLTGAKEGCAEGECGACAILLVSSSIKPRVKSGESGAIYRSINSCLVSLPMMAGQEVYTVESLAGPEGLAQVQLAMMERGGSQCGYCTPGFIVSMFAEQHRPGRRAGDADRLSGNLCRCTGYRPIREAMAAVEAGHPSVNGTQHANPLERRLERSAPRVAPVYYETPQGRFSRPCELDECLEIAADDASSRFVAGNTDLGVLTNLRDHRYQHLISLEGISELREFHDDADGIEIGAGLTLTEIEERWEPAPRFFCKWLDLFASPLLRNRATLGGNLATASPIGDSAPMLLALDATVRIASKNGERTVPLHSFFLDYRRSVLEKGELIRSIRIPKPLAQHVAFYKIAKRNLDDISTVAACIAVSMDGEGRISRARIGLGGVAPVPVRATAAERLLEGKRPYECDLERAQKSLGETLTPISDHRGSSAYRLAMAQRLLEKFWVEQFGGVSV